MSNHVHLVLVRGEQPLERLFKSLHVSFATWAHRNAPSRRTKHARGPLFAARPHCVLVEHDSHLFELIRYVHNNPVRAGIVDHAADSDWSSHQAYVGKAEVPDWLNIGYVLTHFNRRATRARRAFEKFVRAGEDLAKQSELSRRGSIRILAAARGVLGDGTRLSDGILGSASFAAKVVHDLHAARETLNRGKIHLRRGSWERARPPLSQIVDAVLECVGVDAITFSDRPKSGSSQLSRQLIVWLWVHHLGGKQIEVARELSATTYAVSRWYGAALRAAEDRQELTEAVLHLLAGRQTGQSRNTDKRFRYLVEVD